MYNTNGGAWAIPDLDTLCNGGTTGVESLYGGASTIVTESPSAENDKEELVGEDDDNISARSKTSKVSNTSKRSTATRSEAASNAVAGYAVPHLAKDHQSTVLGAAISMEDRTYSNMSQLSAASSKISKASARLGLSSPSATSAAASNTMALANGFHDVDFKADDRDEKETVTDMSDVDATTVPGAHAVRSMTNTKPRSSGRKKLGMVALLALLAIMGLFGVSMYQRSREAAQESTESASMYDCEEGEEGINRRALHIAKSSNKGVDPELSSKIIRRRFIKDMMTTLDGNYDIAVNKGGAVRGRGTGGKQQLRRNLQVTRKGCEKVTSTSTKRTSTKRTIDDAVSMSMSTSMSMSMSTSMCMSISDKKGSKAKKSSKKNKSKKKSTKKIKSKEPSAKKMHSVSMSMCMSISGERKGSEAKSASSAKKMPDKKNKEQV